MNRTLMITATAALLALMTSHHARAQRDDAPPRTEKLSEWPKLKKAEADRARATAKQLRKKKEKLRVAAVEKLTRMGAGVAPVLIPLVSDKAQNVNDDVFRVLDQVTDARHAALLARETKRKSVEWRRYLTRRLAGLRDKELLPVLRTAWQDKDEDIAFYASLGMLALGDGAGLDVVLAAARQQWAEQKAVIGATLEPVRSSEISLLVWERISQARPTDKMAGLRLLRHLATKDQKMQLKAYLESPDFAVKREAINTARVLHGEAPLEKLSSFQAINLAKKWLEKL